MALVFNRANRTTKAFSEGLISAKELKRLYKMVKTRILQHASSGKKG
jgi:hypothetical protein